MTLVLWSLWAVPVTLQVSVWQIMAMRGLLSVWGEFSLEGTCGGALQVYWPVCQCSRPGLHGHRPAHFPSLPYLSQRARLQHCFGTQTYTRYWNPRSKAASHRPPLNGSFVLAEACKELGPRQRGGAGKGLSTKILVTQRSLRR